MKVEDARDSVASKTDATGQYVFCPGDLGPMEAERPCCYTEFVGPTRCWNEIGMRIRWTVPEVPGEFVESSSESSEVSIRMHEPVVLKLCLECKKPVPIREVTTWAWTHLFHVDNHEGIFREIQLHYDESSRTWDDFGVTCYEFQAKVYPTHSENIRLTFNVKFRNYMIWVNKFQVDHILTVRNIRTNSALVDTLRHYKITKNIAMGNYLCSILADELGYEAVLNLDQLTEDQLARMPKPEMINVIRLFNQLNAGGGSEIPEENIFQIVQWIREHNTGNKKVLVSDRCGLGRAGSAMTAYIYANNPNLSFDEAHNYVKKKHPAVFCHKGLRDTLTRLYPRD